jgi:hypothetical protein
MLPEAYSLEATNTPNTTPVTENTNTVPALAIRTLIPGASSPASNTPSPKLVIPLIIMAVKPIEAAQVIAAAQ